MKRAVLVGLAISALLWPKLEASRGAESVDLETVRPGVALSRTLPLSRQETDILIEGLRRWTGFQELGFDANGALSVGDQAWTLGGSAAARALVTAAVQSGDSFIVENHSRSRAVAFAAIRASAIYLDGKGIEHEVWSVKLDFGDFARLRGSGPALLVFDPAINLLHELAHGVLGLPDRVDETDPLGDCERYVNRIRHDLGGPERRSYEPEKLLAASPFGGEQRLIGRFVFVTAEPGKKIRRSLLVFDVYEVVGERRLAGVSACMTE